MEPNPVRLDQGEKLRRPNGQSQRVGNIRRVEKRRINQDWDYLQATQLPNNASTDQIFNAAYLNQGLQPQNLNETETTDQEDGSSRSDASENRSRFSRVNEKSTQKANRSPNRSGSNKTIRNRTLNTKPANSSSLAKKGLARGRITTVNSGVFLVGSNLWLFVQLPLAIISLVSFAAYAAILDGLGFVEGAVAWWFDIEDIVGPLFAITAVMIHLLGILTLIMFYLTYRTIQLKPLSGSKALLKQAAFAIALLGYSLPLLNLLPWGLLVMWVVWLYPE